MTEASASVRLLLAMALVAKAILAFYCGLSSKG